MFPTKDFELRTYACTAEVGQLHRVEWVSPDFFGRWFHVGCSSSLLNRISIVDVMMAGEAAGGGGGGKSTRLVHEGGDATAAIEAEEQIGFGKSHVAWA